MGLPDRTPPGNPPAELPEATMRVRALRGNEAGRSLVARLVPIADRLRQFYTQFGLRPYRVFIVHVVWAGGQKGAGNPIEISRREVLPTPRVRDMAGTNEVLRATGLSEEGGINVDQISAKYSEDDLMGRTLDLQDPELRLTSTSGADFFWEVVENRVVEPTGFRRRYVPSAAPFISADGFQWKVTLTRQDYPGRRSNGALAPRSMF